MSNVGVLMRPFTCAACEKTRAYPFDALNGKSLEPEETAKWTTHGFNANNGRIDRVVIVYACSPECSERITEDPPPPTVKEAKDWLADDGGGLH